MNLKISLITLCLVLTATAAPANQNTPDLNLPLDTVPENHRPYDPNHQRTISPQSKLQVEASANTPQPPEDFTIHYDCEGSVFCNELNIAWCDNAVNFYLRRSDDFYYSTTANETRRGACDGFDTTGCAVFIQGNDDPMCRRTGNQMWWDYQDIRKQGGCTSCGTKHWYPGCMTTIDYVGWCQSDLMDHNKL